MRPQEVDFLTLSELKNHRSIPILIAILLTYIGSLCWEEQCVMTHWMAHHQFANNDHYLSLIFTFHNTFQLFMYFATGFFGDLLFLPVSLH